MHEIKHFLDAVTTWGAIATACGWIVGMLPPLAALASILWIAFQFWHSEPVRAWRGARNYRKAKRK